MSNTQKMQTWHFTFGCDHPLNHHEQPITANSAWNARLKMLDIYGQKWAGQHSPEEWARVAEKYGPYTALPAVEVSEWEAERIAERLGVSA